MSERSTTIIPSTRRSIRSLRITCLAVAALHVILPGQVEAADDPPHVVVTDPYLELHTGPGRGYPIFHVVDRGEFVQVVMRRTDWFFIRDADGVEGWVDRSQMEKTLNADGSRVGFRRSTQDDLIGARWEAGILAGDFDGANVISVYGGYSLTRHVSFELWASQILGNFSNGWMGSINVVHEMRPDWRVSPFFTLGAGIIHTEPKATVVRPDDRTDEVANVGVGVRIYTSRRFLLRAEYKSYVVFTSRDENEEVDEWKVGFAFFF